MEQRWINERLVDPPLSDQGKAELSMLIKGLSREYLCTVMDLDRVSDKGQNPTDKLRLRGDQSTLHFSSIDGPYQTRQR